MKTLMTILWLTAQTAFALPQNFTFDGVLTDSSNATLTGTFSMKFQIYDPGEKCLLYEETQGSVFVDNGSFTVKIGAGTRNSSADGNTPFEKIFQNGAQIRAMGTYCSSADGYASGYTGGAVDDRRLKVTVAGTALTPMYSISPVPMASVAKTLNGKLPSDFIQANPPAPQTLANGELRFGDSGFHVALKVPALTVNTTLTLPGMNGSAGQVLTTDGTGILSWTTPSVGGGSIPVGGSGGEACGSSIGGGSLRYWTGNMQYCDGNVWHNIASLGSPIMAPNGAAASPSMSFGGDSGTGLFNPTVGEIGFAAGAVERMRITSTGLGIGTTSPSTPLHVEKNQDASTAIQVRNSDTGTMVDSRLSLSANGSTGYIAKRSTNYSAEPGMLVIANNSDHSIKFKTGSTLLDRMTLTNGGYLGIGTNSPLSDISIFRSSSTAVGLYIENPGATTNAAAAITLKTNSDSAMIYKTSPSQSGAFVFQSSSSTPADFRFTPDGSNISMVIKSNGPVGIATTNPGFNTALRVQGQMAAASYDAGSSYNLDFSMGNSITTSHDCGSTFTLANMRDGGSYSVVITGSGTTQCNFSTSVTGDDSGSVTYRYDSANSARTAASHTVYNMRRIGNNVYVSWKSYM